jgi:osmotically inducible protein OsmC
MERKGRAEWNGGLKGGSGRLSAATGVLSNVPYSFTTRFENEPGTNPEELIATAHAACFSMALSADLEGAGHVLESVETTATVTLEKTDAGMSVTKIHLDTKAVVSGLDDAAFQQIAEKAKAGCPISRLLSPGTQISMTASLA